MMMIMMLLLLVYYHHYCYYSHDCHLLSDAGRRPLRSHSNDRPCHEHTTNLATGVSRLPVLDCGMTFHPGFSGRDSPSILLDDL